MPVGRMVRPGGRIASRMVFGGRPSLLGTTYWPAWDDAILFLETSEEVPPPEQVDGILADYENMGVLDQLQGLLVGRPVGYSADEKDELRRVLRERTASYDFPIVTDMDFGHTAPQLTLPIGCRARIDTSCQRFEILEGAVSSGEGHPAIAST